MLLSNRLTLKELSIDDLYKVHELHSLPETDEFNTLGIPESIEITKAIIRGWLLGHTSSPRVQYTYRVNLIDDNNIGSIKVLEKVGMIREGMKRANLPIRGEWKDNYIYAVLDTDDI